MEQSAARLRKTFHYPTENDSDDSLPEALDEEEQEKLISRLATENSSRNQQYTYLFLALPCVSSLLYLLPLFRPATSLLSLLALSSLGISAWTLHALPSNKTGIVYIDVLNTPKTKETEGRDLPQLGARVDKSPLELYLPYLNLGLIAILFLGGLVLKEGLTWPGFGLLPACVYGFVVGAKLVMGSVDVGELEGLKYTYKGA